MQTTTVETIKMRSTRDLFVTKKGLPRKECLKTVPDIYTEQRIPLSPNRIERTYQMQVGNAVVHAVRRYFRGHHCNWIDPKLGRWVYHGFSDDEDKQYNSLARSENRKQAHIESHKEHEQLVQENIKRIEN